MTVNSVEFLRGMYNTARLLGDMSINSDATLEIEAYEDMLVLTKQFP
ncbi:MAG: hypothetical protein V4772_19790 [Pseudomonadota bacterium]